LASVVQGHANYYAVPTNNRNVVLKNSPEAHSLGLPHQRASEPEIAMAEVDFAEIERQLEVVLDKLGGELSSSERQEVVVTPSPFMYQSRGESRHGYRRATAARQRLAGGHAPRQSFLRRVLPRILSVSSIAESRAA